MKRMRVSIPVALKQEVKRIADREGKSMSGLVREMIARGTAFMHTAGRNEQ